MKLLRLSTLAALFASLFIAQEQSYANVKSGSSFAVHSTVFHDEKFTGKLLNGKAYVDFEGLQKVLPYNVSQNRFSWVAETKTLYVTGESYPDLKTSELRFENGKDYFYVSEQKIKTDSKILIYKNKMYFPLQPLASYYHLRLKWNEKHTAVVITNGSIVPLPVIANTVNLKKDDLDQLVDVTVKYFSYANDRDFKKYASVLDSKPSKFEELDPLFFLWKDAAIGKQTLRRIDFVTSDDNGEGTAPRVIADVKWTESEMQVAYLKRGDLWTIASLD